MQEYVTPQGLSETQDSVPSEFKCFQTIRDLLLKEACVRVLLRSRPTVQTGVLSFNFYVTFIIY